MKSIFCALIVLIAFSSCNNLKLAASKQNVSSIALDYSLGKKVNPIYQSLVDSTFDVVMAKFNAEQHSFTVHKKNGNEADVLSFDFSKGKFVKKSGLITGYIVTGIGLIATPIAVLSATGGEAVILFYYWPSDKFEFTATLSPSLAEKPGKKVNNLVQTGALFSSKKNRLKRISNKLDERIYKLLVRIDKQVKKAN